MEKKTPWYKNAAVLAGLGFAIIVAAVFFIAMHLASMKP